MSMWFNCYYLDKSAFLTVDVDQNCYNIDILLEAIRDEFPKQTYLVFPELSGINVANINMDDVSFPSTRCF